MAFPQPKKVLILGGSLSSLSHAAVLRSHRPDISITILERSPSALLHNQGAGIVAGPDVTHFFDKYVKPGRSVAVTSQQRLYLDKAGKTIDGSVEDRQQHMTSWDVLYRLLRWRVDGMDVGDYLHTDPDFTPKAEDERNDNAKTKYEYGCKVTSLEDLGPTDGIKVTYEKDSATHTATADLVIAADGGSSSARAILRPDVKRTYVGYVALRGTVPETELSSDATSVFREKFAFYHADGIQILAYTIPGKNGTIEPGKRLVNYVWYVNFEDHSPELEDLMTDDKGKRYPITLPVGGMKASVWEKQRQRARQTLPPQFAELVEKTKQPFVQAITDVICDENRFFDGRVWLVGDALAGFRPHTAASTGQATFDALTLGEWVGGKIDEEEYCKRVLHYSKRLFEQGVKLGERSQFGRHPLDGSI